MSIGRKKRVFVGILSFLAVLWIILTLLAQRKGGEAMHLVGLPSNPQKALVVYNPDLFYNLDEQVCNAFAKGLSEFGWQATVATVSAAEDFKDVPYDLFVFCANTYNWAPDIPTKNYIDNHSGLSGNNVVAITLGSGSTERAQRILETLLEKRGAKLIESKAYWLMRPNDESRTDESNVAVAVEVAQTLGGLVAEKMALVNE